MPDSKETEAVPSTTKAAGRTTSRPKGHPRQEKARALIRPGDRQIRGVLYPVDLLLALSVEHPSVKLYPDQNDAVVYRRPDVELCVDSKLAVGSE